MLKAYGSAKNLEDSEFFSYINDILNSSAFQQLQHFTHHVHTTRYQHCINVSYYNYLICRKLKLNARSAARAGLLHDLFFYDCKSYKNIYGNNKHYRKHPFHAFDNASQIFLLSPLEKDIILKHMWPVTIKPPKYKEAFVIVFIDKYCAVLEYFYPLSDFFKNFKNSFIHLRNHIC